MRKKAPKDLPSHVRLQKMAENLKLPNARKTQEAAKEFAKFCGAPFNSLTLEQRDGMKNAMANLHEAWAAEKHVVKESVAKQRETRKRHIKDAAWSALVAMWGAGLALFAGMASAAETIFRSKAVVEAVGAGTFICSAACLAKPLVNYVRIGRIMKRMEGEMKAAEQAIKEISDYGLQGLRDLANSGLLLNSRNGKRAEELWNTRKNGAGRNDER